MRALLGSIMCILILVVFHSCSSKEEIDVSMNFRLTYDGEPLVMTQDYVYPDGKIIRFNRFSFFVSDIVLQDGECSVELEDPEFINLTRSHLDVVGSEGGFDFELGMQPLSSLNEVSFNIGLNESQNATVPADYQSEDELARPGEYWLAWDSYIFFKIEGFVDLDGDNDPETSVALHVGADESRRAVSLINSSEDNTISIVIDVRDIFDSGEVYDIANNAQIHSLSQLPLAEFLADNFSNNITVD